jgi:hypothetical protein
MMALKNSFPSTVHDGSSVVSCPSIYTGHNGSKVHIKLCKIISVQKNVHIAIITGWCITSSSATATKQYKTFTALKFISLPFTYQNWSFQLLFDATVCSKFQFYYFHFVRLQNW